MMANLHFCRVFRKLPRDGRQLLVPAVGDAVDTLARLRTRPPVAADDDAAVGLAGVVNT